MSGSNTDLFSYFVEPDQRPRWVYLVGIALAGLFATGCWMQTDSFVKRFDLPTYQSIREHIVASQLIQESIRKKARKEKPTEGVAYLGFTESQVAQLEEARRFVLSDCELEKKLKDQFGISLSDVHAVVLPLWETDNIGYCSYIGITADGGWPEVHQASGDCAVGATTIRDRPGQSQKTLDGTPRIVLNPNAFANTSWTRRVMFHEMLHAANIPGFRPSRLTWAQTDLIYLWEYRWYVAKADVKSWDELLYRFFACFFWAVSGLSVCLLLVGTYRRHKPSRVLSSKIG